MNQATNKKNDVLSKPFGASITKVPPFADMLRFGAVPQLLPEKNQSRR